MEEGNPKPPGSETPGANLRNDHYPALLLQIFIKMVLFPRAIKSLNEDEKIFFNLILYQKCFQSTEM